MHKSVKIIGVGSPIIDHLAHVSEEVVSLIAGGKGGMELVDTAVMKKLLEDSGRFGAVLGGETVRHDGANLPHSAWKQTTVLFDEIKNK